MVMFLYFAFLQTCNYLDFRSSLAYRRPNIRQQAGFCSSCFCSILSRSTIASYSCCNSLIFKKNHDHDGYWSSMKYSIMSIITSMIWLRLAGDFHGKGPSLASALKGKIKISQWHIIVLGRQALHTLGNNFKLNLDANNNYHPCNLPAMVLSLISRKYGVKFMKQIKHLSSNHLRDREQKCQTTMNEAGKMWQ